MQTLKRVTPTAEQLPLISRTRPGIEVIRGAAGSGKTTTALLRLRSLASFYLSRKERTGDDSPVRVVVLTYNRTLKGYVSRLVAEESGDFSNVHVTVDTFAHWAWTMLDEPSMLSDREYRNTIQALGDNLPLTPEFLLDEIDYVLGRFLPNDLQDYLATTRVGRGLTPRVDVSLRKRVLDEVVVPYQNWKKESGLLDWNDLAVQLASNQQGSPLDVVIADETQDFSANQIRAIIAQLADAYNVTFVMDAAQRIYARGFTWREAGAQIQQSHKLDQNYRNTVEIARFAASLLTSLTVEDDGALPNFETCVRRGPKPRVLRGTFSSQMAYALEQIRHIDLAEQSVAFLHPAGGGWFDYTRNALLKSDYGFVELTRRSDWPEGPENIALSTLSSAKGLEFDHVFVLGLSAETMHHGEEDDDDRLSMFRRLLAMGVGRARQTVAIGYKPGEASRLLDFLDPATFEEVNL